VQLVFKISNKRYRQTDRLTDRWHAISIPHFAL